MKHSELGNTAYWVVLPPTPLWTSQTGTFPAQNQRKWWALHQQVIMQTYQMVVFNQGELDAAAADCAIMTGSV